MRTLPKEFHDEFEQKGDTFFKIAELLYRNPDRPFTQEELAERMDCSTTTVSNHITKMEDSEWLNRRKNQTVFAWNKDVHNPASTEGTTALRNFYADVWGIVKKHSETVPGTFALIGATMILAALVVFAFYIGFSLSITQESEIPAIIYATIALGSFLTGLLVSFLSPIQAKINSLVWRYLPVEKLQRD
ncbi:MarR family transcriptional regulator [Halorubrum sp. DM2]|uniref:MarR family transcriptional regulator n=1 Tax=Halorubrum sp. DM2 TaxID=2527867 RepID=UPI0024B76026|nr:MarR family transcriptional regulator [Halorubrum sp. DM2]